MTAPEEKLRLAAAEGNVLRVQTFLEQGISPQTADAHGVTPLFLAAKNGHRDVVALLLGQGADVNAHARIGGVTLLHVGAFRGDHAMVTLLLQHGADKNARMSSGERPVDLAHTQGHQVLIPLLEP
jgi:ankyrin